jgi:hypothetical protein
LLHCFVSHSCCRLCSMCGPSRLGELMFCVQVCIAMVPGGCVIRHPHASLDQQEDAACPNMWTLWDQKTLPKFLETNPILENDTQGKTNLLNMSYWMHNARCCFIKDSYFVHAEKEVHAVQRKHLIHEAGYFFEQLWVKKITEFDTPHPAFVSLAFLLSECCAYSVTRLPAFIILNALRWRRSCLIVSATS